MRGAGTYTLTCAIDARTRRILDRSGNRLPVRVRIAFDAANGATAVATRTVAVRPAPGPAPVTG